MNLIEKKHIVFNIFVYCGEKCVLVNWSGYFIIGFGVNNSNQFRKSTFFFIIQICFILCSVCRKIFCFEDIEHRGYWPNLFTCHGRINRFINSFPELPVSHRYSLWLKLLSVEVPHAPTPKILCMITYVIGSDF